MDPRASSSGSKTPQTSSSAGKTLHASSSTIKTPQASSSESQDVSLNYDDELYVPPGQEIWLGDFIIAKLEEGVYHPYLFAAHFAVLQGMRSKEDPKKVEFKVHIISGEKWLKYMASFSAEEGDYKILKQALKTEKEYTLRKRLTIQNLKRTAVSLKRHSDDKVKKA